MYCAIGTERPWGRRYMVVAVLDREGIEKLLLVDSDVIRLWELATEKNYQHQKTADEEVEVSKQHHGHDAITSAVGMVGHGNVAGIL